MFRLERLRCIDCWHWWLTMFTRDDFFKPCPMHEPERYRHLSEQLITKGK